VTSAGSRERVRAAIRFEPPDRLPRHDSPWTQTVERWRREGMPADVSVADHFGFDVAMTYLDASPRFEMRVLERSEKFFTYEDRYGYTMRKIEHGEGTIDFRAHPLTGRDAWEEDVRPRLVLATDPAEPARLDDASYFAHFDPYPTWEEAVEKHRRLAATGRYVLAMVYGPWEALWRLRGMEALLMDLVDDPEWVEEMAAVHVDLVIDVVRHGAALGARPDGLLLAEDLGSTAGPLFSPRTWDALFRPHFERLASALREEEIDFWVHSDGRIDEFVERFVDVGVQVLNPLEVKAGMDAVELRRRVGDRLAFHGNISARAMAGPRDALEAELERKIPLARQGGFLMHSDHSVPPDVGYEQFAWMQRRAQEIFEARG